MKLKFICPACGGNEFTEVSFGKTRRGSSRTKWFGCTGCSLQGPKPVWEAMAKRRATMEAALNVAKLTEQDRRYQQMIEDFGRKMFRELKANDARKGDFSAWKPDRQQAIEEVTHHFEKLIVALDDGEKSQITEFCADLANIVMAADKHLGAA